MIHIIAGTRPEFIKIAPIVWELQKEEIDYRLIVTGQHFDRAMGAERLKEFGIEWDYHFGINASDLSKLMNVLNEFLDHTRPDVVLVQGDTNTGLAGALTAHNLGIPVAHVEAGYTSRNWDMPEERNRFLIDSIASYCYCPTDSATINLKTRKSFHYAPDYQEIYFTGNTIIDIIKHFENQLGDVGPEMIMTLHRPENVDNVETFQGILNGVSTVAKNKIVQYYLHPRVRKLYFSKPKQKKLVNIPSNVHINDPIPIYKDMLTLIKNAKLIFTDSGGILEEAFYFQIPLIQIREKTERPEVLRYNTSLTSGNSPELIFDAWQTLQRPHIKKYTEMKNLFGDGTASKKIVAHLKEVLK